MFSLSTFRFHCNFSFGEHTSVAASFSVKCGGTEQISSSGIKFDDDSENLGAASMYMNSNYQWAVSTTGNFISNPKGPLYIAKTDTQITGTLDSELYKTARISPSSLRYYGLSLKNGKYTVELHFAEITMDDGQSWKGLGKRLFDIYIQVFVETPFSMDIEKMLI